MKALFILILCINGVTSSARAAEGDKYVIIHADDFGLSHGVNKAVIDAIELGTVSSTSILVTSDAAEDAVQMYSRSRGKADIGVHANFTSDWNNGGSRPVTSAAKVKSLLSKNGIFYKSPEDFLKHARPDEVEVELKAQILRAKSWGLPISHVDSHMGVLYFTVPNITALISAANQTDIVASFTRWADNLEGFRKELGNELVDQYLKISEAYTAQQGRGVDYLYTEVGGDTLKQRRQNYYRLFQMIKPGVSEILVDLAYPSKTLAKLTRGNPYEHRHQDVEIFTDPETLKVIQSNGLKLIGFKDLNSLEN